jgi:hypothetical protein
MLSLVPRYNAALMRSHGNMRKVEGWPKCSPKSKPAKHGQRDRLTVNRALAAVLRTGAGISLAHLGQLINDGPTTTDTD